MTSATKRLLQLLGKLLWKLQPRKQCSMWESTPRSTYWSQITNHLQYLHFQWAKIRKPELWYKFFTIFLWRKRVWDIANGHRLSLPCSTPKRTRKLYLTWDEKKEQIWWKSCNYSFTGESIGIFYPECAVLSTKKHEIRNSGLFTALLQMYRDVMLFSKTHCCSVVTWIFFKFSGRSFCKRVLELIRDLLRLERKSEYYVNKQRFQDKQSRFCFIWARRKTTFWFLSQENCKRCHLQSTFSYIKFLFSLLMSCVCSFPTV